MWGRQLSQGHGSSWVELQDKHEVVDSSSLVCLWAIQPSAMFFFFFAAQRSQMQITSNMVSFIYLWGQLSSSFSFCCYCFELVLCIMDTSIFALTCSYLISISICKCLRLGGSRDWKLDVLLRQKQIALFFLFFSLLSSISWNPKRTAHKDHVSLLIVYAERTMHLNYRCINLSVSPLSGAFVERR